MSSLEKVLGQAKVLSRKLAGATALEERPLDDEMAEDLQRVEEAVGDALLDPEFHRIVEEQFEMRRRLDHKVMQIVTNEQLYRAFVAGELALLERAGVQPDAAREFLLQFVEGPSLHSENAAKTCCDRIVPLELLANRAPTEIYQVLDKLRGGVGHAAQRVGAGSRKPGRPAGEPARVDWRRVLTGALHGTLGIGLFGLNATAWAATLGISGPGTAISAGLGAIACERAYNRIFDAFESA